MKAFTPVAGVEEARRRHPRETCTSGRSLKGCSLSETPPPAIHSCPSGRRHPTAQRDRTLVSCKSGHHTHQALDPRYLFHQRAPSIHPGIEADLNAYIGGICRRMDSPLLAMGGTQDHVHMMLSLAKTVALSDLLLNVKRDSSKWIHERGLAFAWQDGYFAFSIGASGVDGLRAYLAEQKQHHRNIDFKDEVRALLRKYGLEWDERFAWD